MCIDLEIIMVVRHSKVFLLLISVVSLLTEAQRGCPVEGCDSRGLYCQADFQVGPKSPTILWHTDIGNATNDRLVATGCVGNDKNVVCRITDSHSKGYVAVNATTGAVLWYDTLLSSPRMPVMNQQGDYIATDGNFLEIRLKNGSLIGKPLQFHGYLGNASSVHFIDEVAGLFFFTSYKTGGLYLFDTSGMCVASYFIDEKDPKTNQTISTWLAVSQIIVNKEMNPPTGYFLARNNVTMKHRIVALNFNHQPPYLMQKWYVEIFSHNENHGTRVDCQLLSLRDYLVFGYHGGLIVNLIIIKDNGNNGGSIDERIYYNTGVFASYDMPLDLKNERSHGAPPPIIWMDERSIFTSTVLGYPLGTPGPFKYIYNLTRIFNFDATFVTSQIMVFGYSAENVTLVFAFTGQYLPRSRHNKTLPTYSRPGNYIVAMRPATRPGWTVSGQIIGVNNNILIANSYSDTSSRHRLIGIQVSAD